MRKFFRIFLYIVGSILLLLFLAVMLLQTPWGKDFVRKKVLAFLRGQLNTEVQIAGLDYTLPDNITLTGVLVRDTHNDTLLYAGYLYVDMNMWALVRNKVTVHQIALRDVNAHIYRSATDTVFNYDFIVRAFSNPADTVATAPTEDTAASELVYDIGKVALNNIRFQFNDTAGGSFFAINLRDLLLRPGIVDIDRNRYDVNELRLAGVSAYFISDTSYLPPEPEDTTAASDFQIAVSQLQLDTVQFAFENIPDNFYFDIDLGKLRTDIKHFGLSESLVQIGRLQLENTVSTIRMGAGQTTPQTAPTATDSTEAPWRVLVDNIALNEIAFKMDDNTQPRLTHGMDYAHLDIQHFFLNASSLNYGPDTISANLKHLALKEQSGLNIMELRSKVLYHSKGAALQDLYLLTPYTLLQDKLVVSYPSLDAVSAALEKMHLDIALRKSKVGINDLLLFMPPDQRAQLLPYQNQSVLLSAQMKGYLNELLVKQLYLAGLDGTIIDLDGRIKGLPHPDHLYYDFNLRQIRSTRTDLAPFLPDSLKRQIRLPEWLAINGTLKGSVTDYYPDVMLRSSDGTATVKGFLLMSPGTDKDKYDLQLHTENLNLGGILRQDSLLGFLTMNGNVQGQSFNPEKMNSDFNLDLNRLDLMGYRYKGVHLRGSVVDKMASVLGFSDDPNLSFRLDGNADLSGAYPSLVAELEMDHVDLYALHFASDTLALAGKIAADFSSLNPDYPAGSLFWTDPKVTLPGRALRLDSISFVSNPVSDSIQDIYLNASNVLQATLTGKIPLTQAGNALLSHVSRHYRLKDTAVAELSAYDMQVDGRIMYHPLLKHLAPELLPFDTIRFGGGLNPDTFGFNAYIPQLVYGTNVIDSVRLVAFENADSFKYNLGIKKYNNEQIQLWSPSIRGRIRSDSVYALVNVDDSAQNHQFTLGAAMTRNLQVDSSKTYIRLFPGLRFDYNIWKVNPQNRIVLDEEGFYIRDFEMSREDQSIAIQNESESAKSPLQVLIRNFGLANLTRMMSKDTLIAEGHLNLDAQLQFADSFPDVNATLSIPDLVAYNQPVGALDVVVGNRSGGTYHTELKLSGSGNHLLLDGEYHMVPVDGNDLDFHLRLRPLILKTIQGFTFGALKGSEGALVGDLDIRGKADNPVITGQLQTVKLATTVSALNAYFMMPDELITFEPRKILFNNFTIEDSSGHKARINGNIRIPTFDQQFLDLRFDARRWQALHSTKKDNPEYYGDLILSANITAKGSATAPIIEGDVTIHDSTDLHYAMIDEGPGIVASEGIVKFVDSRDTSTVDSIRLLPDDKIRFSQSAQVNVNVALEKEASFTVLIDPASGDRIQVQGEAALNTFLGPDGSIGLTGTYELDDGFYEMNYNFLRRKFDIKKGSIITLAGDPLDAEADITAVYDANIAPYDLVEKQVTPEQLVYYKQRLPFQVMLKIKGKVMRPEITFDIVLPEDKATRVSSDVANLVQAKLTELRNNPSDMNKQVFAILILGRFIAEDPFASGAGVDVEYAARKSVSKFLSDQLNQIAGALVQGLELNFDLNSTEDYSTGTKTNRTDLNISASKRLLNDRLKITVGNDFVLEGQSGQRQQSSLIPGNLSADYQLTRDGRYLIRAYRTNELQNIIEGYVVETGVGFRINLEYNKFKYIFRNRRKMMRKMRRADTGSDRKNDSEPTHKEGTKEDNEPINQSPNAAQE